MAFGEGKALGVATAAPFIAFPRSHSHLTILLCFTPLLEFIVLVRGIETHLSYAQFLQSYLSLRLVGIEERILVGNSLISKTRAIILS